RAARRRSARGVAVEGRPTRSGSLHSAAMTPDAATSGPAAEVSAEELAHLHTLVMQSQASFLDDLATLVNIDCGSYTKAGVDRVGRWTARFLERLGATVTTHPNDDLGDTVVGILPGEPGGPRLILIGHM